MKAPEIEAILAADPNAEIAVVPSRYAASFTRLRGLTKVGRGKWHARERCYLGKWHASHTAYTSARLCTIADAEQQVSQVIVERKVVAKADARAEHVADLLRARGIRASADTRAAGCVLVIDTELLAQLLAPAEGSDV